MIGADIWAIVVCVAGVIGVGWIFWVMRTGDRDRDDEDAARAFFDEHGHWPDESPEHAAAERRRLAEVSAAAAPQVSQPSSDGLV